VDLLGNDPVQSRTWKSYCSFFNDCCPDVESSMCKLFTNFCLV